MNQQKILKTLGECAFHSVTCITHLRLYRRLCWVELSFAAESDIMIVEIHYP
jgi:hypothetical protein